MGLFFLMIPEVDYLLDFLHFLTLTKYTILNRPVIRTKTVDLLNATSITKSLLSSSQSWLYHGQYCVVYMNIQYADYSMYANVFFLTMSC